MIRLALTACSHLLAGPDARGPQFTAAALTRPRRPGFGRSPGALGCDVSLAIDYLDFASAPGSTR